MKKLLKMTLWTLLFVLLALWGSFFFVFSQTGNEMLKPYVKQRIEEKIGMPVEVSHFRLESGRSSLDFIVNGQAVVNVVTHYNLYEGSFEGIYRIKADTFKYEEIQFTKADLKGNFKGKAEDIYVDGQGTMLDGEIEYSLNVIDEVAQKIVLTMKEAQLAAVLQLNGYPALAEGKIDIDINMPNIGENAASGDGHIVLKKATFNRQLVKDLYNYTLPENSYVTGAIDAGVTGKTIQLRGEVKSNLFMLKITDGQIDTAAKKMSSVYSLDVQDMRILTRNKLAGPFTLNGNIQREGKNTRVSGKSNSLGGELHLLVQDTIKLTLEKLSLERLLPFLKAPDYAKGEVSGTIVLDDRHRESGNYDLHIDKGVLKSKALQKLSRYNIPEDNTFTLEAKGEIAKKQLTGDIMLKSTLMDAVFTSVVYDSKEKLVVSEYDLLVHDVNALIPMANRANKAAVSAEGSLKYKDRLSISGMMKGMGENVSFSYDSQRLKVDASKLLVEKILALTANPIYVKGTMDAKADFTSLKPHQGSFELKGDNLVTDPKVMEKLTGEALEAAIEVQSSGTFKEGIGNIDTKIKSSLGSISLPDMVYDTKKKNIQSSYVIDVPELQKLRNVIDRKLYGPLVLKGEFSKDELVKLTGTTQTLGGNIAYTLIEDHLTSTIGNVPLENILGLLGHRKDFLGKAFGEGKYDLRSKSGIVDLDIQDFQIKPSSTTQTIKMLIGKDPTRVIFTTTKFHADLKGKITEYSLHATGSHSGIDITEGRIDKINNTNTAKLKFVYDEYTVYGKIKGSIDDPKVTVDTSALFQDKIDQKLQDKIEKALGGKAGDILKNLKF